MDFIFVRLIAKSTVYISSTIDYTEDDDRFLHLVHRVEDFKIIDGHGTHLGMFRKLQPYMAWPSSMIEAKTSSTGRTLPSVKSAKPFSISSSSSVSLSSER